MPVVLLRRHGLDCRAVDTSNVAVLLFPRPPQMCFRTGSQVNLRVAVPFGQFLSPIRSYWFSRKDWPAMVSSGTPQGASGIGAVSTCGVLPLGNAAGSAGVVAAVS